jgi:hypothetical protein
MVLGGYPTDSSFRSFEDDATALLITFPVDASERVRERAIAWEQAFVNAVRPAYSFCSTVVATGGWTSYCSWSLQTRAVHMSAGGDARCAARAQQGPQCELQC